MLLPGYWNFPTPDQIPEDLLLDFGDFAKKYGIEAAVPQIVTIAGGVGTPITTPTLYMMQAFGAPMARALLTGSSLVPSSRNNSELYSRIAEQLGDDVLYSSEMVEAERNSSGVFAFVRSSNGDSIVIHAKRLLITIEPTIQNMAPLALDDTEKSVFGKWQYSNLYASIVSHPSLPKNGALVNTPLEAAPSDYLAIPQLPYLARFSYIGPPGFRGLIGVNRTLSSTAAKRVVEDSLEQLIRAGTVPRSEGNINLKWVAFSDHGAMHLRVGKEDLRKGFIQAQYRLQGRKETWYTGAAWSAQYTSLVWAFTDTILGKLVEGI